MGERTFNPTLTRRRSWEVAIASAGLGDARQTRLAAGLAQNWLMNFQASGAFQLIV